MNIYAWIAFGAMGLVWLSIAAMFLICGADLKHKIIGSIACVCLWLLMSGGIYLDAKWAKDAWNGGYCECGEHWELKGVSESRNGNTTKYYACPNCYAEIEQ